jgi:1-deoxy-D-xylulose-5-phosphate synthase
MFDEIPVTRPATPLLDSVTYPADLRQLAPEQLETLAQELREFLLYSVGQTGGHFGAGLGVVELTIALHYVFNTPHDRLVWDVGHQSYPHKILTGRRERMLTIRQAGGLAAFNSRNESEYDTFGVGHSSTSISAALGMVVAAQKQQSDRKVVAVIGDGAMTAGMAFEALNHGGELDNDILIILNDNNMSISRNVGGLSSYFARMWASKPYNFLRAGSKKVMSKVPPVWKAAHRAEEYMKGMVSPATIFEELGFNYIGLIDGHDVNGLVDILRDIKDLKGPRLLHVVTRKGKGYRPAEEDPYGMHALNKMESQAQKSAQVPDNKVPSYSQVFGDWLCTMAPKEPALMAITPAMGEGSGMRRFEEEFPDRFFDVGIAEQHAITFAAGLACEGLKPVVAIYSTFLQRGYDQVVHDVALQNLDVLFAIDRAGLVGEDGPTHAGSFDLSFLRCLPNFIVMTPSDENEARHMLYTGYHYAGPAAVRYPRGKATGIAVDAELRQLELGKAHVVREGKDVAILAFGTLLHVAREAADRLDATLVDMRFVKPLDEQLLTELAERHQLFVTVEENTLMGGAGSAVGEFLDAQELQVPLLSLGLPDRFLEHGRAPDLLAACGLDANGIETSIRKRLAALR